MQLQKQLKQFSNKNIHVVAISVDNLKEAKSLSQKHRLGFPLLSDENGTTIKKFGLWDPGNSIAWPGVYVVKKGKITWQYLSETYATRPLPELLLAQF